jgi:hypothetical protein
MPVHTPATVLRERWSFIMANTLPVRKEVLDFLKASETLLAYPMFASEFTPEECDVIADYIMTLSQARHPWGKSLTVRYS